MKKNYTAKCAYMHVADSGLGDTYQILKNDASIVRTHSIDEIFSVVNDYLKNVSIKLFASKVVADVKITDDDDPDFILKYNREVDRSWQQQS